MKKLGILIAGAALTASAEPLPPKKLAARQLICAVLILEAGGEVDKKTGNSRKGMALVWEVIWRRAELRKQSPLEVVTARKQFSCLNNMKPGKAIEIAQRHPAWRHAWGITGAPPVTRWTGGATHYYSTAIPAPYWATPETRTAKIGNHIFHKLTR